MASYMPATVMSGSYLPPPMQMGTQVASWVPPQAVETVMYESMQPVSAFAQPVVAMAQPVYAQAQPVYAQAQPVMYESAQPVYAQAQPVSTSLGSIDMLNQAISVGEVARPQGAAAYYELYCRMNGQAMPTAVASTASAYPQQMVTVEKVMAQPSYLPPPQQFVETVQSYAPQQKVFQGGTYVEQMMMPEYAMAEQVQTYSYMPQPQYTEPMAMAAPMMAAPMMQTVAAPMMAAPMIQQAQPMMMAAPGGQPESVILDEVGDWLICEDAMGLFYHHGPSQQSYDQPPAELVQYYQSQGVQLAPTGAFGVQAGMVQQAPMQQMTYQVQTMPGQYF